MKRKINLVGSNTLTVSLPSKWVKNNHVKKGDEINIELIGKEVIISKSEISSNLRTLEVTLPSPDNFMRRYITTPYKKGYDEIKVVFDDINTLELIKEALYSRMMGFEMIYQGNNYCILKNVAEGLSSEFDNLFNRLFHILISMLNDLNESLQKKDINRLQSIIKVEVMSNKLCEFCQRLLNKGCKNELSDTTAYYTIAVLLEQLTDDLRYVCNFIVKTNIWPTKEVIIIFNKINVLANLTYKAFQKKDQHFLIELKKSRDQMNLDMVKQVNKLKNHDIVFLCLFTSFLNKLDHLSYDIYSDK